MRLREFVRCLYCPVKSAVISLSLTKAEMIVTSVIISSMWWAADQLKPFFQPPSPF